MAGVQHPTVLVGVGSIGQKIVERARRSLDETSELLRVVSEPTQTLRERFIQTLDPLLRAGRRVSSVQGRRLDVLAFASALQGTDDELVGVCDALSRAIGGNYAAIFPPNSHPEQRTATLHLVVAVPALARSAPARRALGRLLRVERWASGEVAYPLLSRVWLSRWKQTYAAAVLKTSPQWPTETTAQIEGTTVLSSCERRVRVAEPPCRPRRRVPHNSRLNASQRSVVRCTHA